MNIKEGKWPEKGVIMKPGKNRKEKKEVNWRKVKKKIEQENRKEIVELELWLENHLLSVSKKKRKQRVM